MTLKFTDAEKRDWFTEVRAYLLEDLDDLRSRRRVWLSDLCTGEEFSRNDYEQATADVRAMIYKLRLLKRVQSDAGL